MNDVELTLKKLCSIVSIFVNRDVNTPKRIFFPKFASNMSFPSSNTNNPQVQMDTNGNWIQIYCHCFLKLKTIISQSKLSNQDSTSSLDLTSSEPPPHTPTTTPTSTSEPPPTSTSPPMATLPSSVDPVNSGRSLASLFITLCPDLTHPMVLRRIGNITDTLLSVESFAGRQANVPVEFRFFCGFFNVHKLQHVGAISSPHRPSAKRFGLQRDRRKLHIEPLHLPPEESRASKYDSKETKARTEKQNESVATKASISGSSFSSSSQSSHSESVAVSPSSPSSSTGSQGPHPHIPSHVNVSLMSTTAHVNSHSKSANSNITPAGISLKEKIAKLSAARTAAAANVSLNAGGICKSNLPGGSGNLDF